MQTNIHFTILLILSLSFQVVAFTTQTASTQNNLIQDPSDNQVSKIIAKIEANYSQIKTISGKILQTGSFRDATIQNKLNFSLELPDRIYIDSLIPQRQTIVSDGKICWSYSPSQNKAIKADSREIRETILSPMKFLEINIFEELREAFDFRIEKKGDDQITICAVPKSGGRLISQVIVEVDPVRWVILSTKIFDKKDDLISETSYEKYQLFNKSIWFPLEIKTNSLVEKERVKENTFFHRVRLNQEIPEERFNFTPPAGVEILFLEAENSLSLQENKINNIERR
jgi:outer membrane lipoprotein-sorting protein